MSKRDLLFSVLSGVLIFSSFPKLGCSIAAFFALVPLLHALQGKTLREGFAAGVVTGLVGNVGLLYWIAYVVVQYGYLPIYVGGAAMLALAAILSLYTGLFGAGVSYFRKRAIPDMVSAPLLWTAIEYAKSHLFTGFPWGNLAYSQYLNTYLVQIADVTGTFGITFFIVVINVIVYDVLRTRRLKDKVIWAKIVGGMVLTVLVLGYGHYRAGAVLDAFRGRPAKDVLIVQGNIDQSVKWDPTYQKETIDIYERLSRVASASRTDLIVWPETAAPFYFQDMDEKHRDVVGVAVRSGSYLLLGSPSYRLRNGRELVQNSAFLVGPSGEIVGRYDKVHLVPYGEYVPLRSVFPFLGRLIADVGDFLPGRVFNLLAMGETKIGTLICYEAIFPEIADEYGRKGADVFVNITNDAWFGRTAAPWQHLSMVTLRSVENRKYTVRAANTGISAVIDPLGRIVARTDLFERTTLNGRVYLGSDETFYTRRGDVFAWGCLMVLTVLFLITFTRRRK